MSFVRFQKSARARRGVQAVLIAICLVFVAGAFWSFGRPMPVGSQGRDQTVLAVDRQSIPGSRFWQAFEQYRNWMGSGVDTYFATMYMTVNEIVREVVTSEKAKALGITASPADLEAKRKEYIDQQIARAGDGPDRNRFLVEQDITWKDYATKVSRDARARNTEFKAQIVDEKLRDALTKDVTVSDDELLAKYRTFTLRHILVKIPTEQDKQSWLESHPGAESSPESAASESASGESAAAARNRRPQWFSRTEEQALAIAQGLRKRIVEGKEDFAAVAKGSSDDTMSALEGGSLGDLNSQALAGMVPEFREAVVAMNTGDISEPVKSQFGYHIIKVDKRTDGEVPKDFEQTKEQQRETELKSKRQRIYGEEVRKLVQNANVTFVDKEPHIAWLLGNRKGERPKAEEEAAAREALQLIQDVIDEKTKQYEEASRASGEPMSPEGLAQYYYQIGVIYKEQKQWESALPAFQQAMDASPGWESQLEYGRALIELGRGKEAIQYLKAVSEDTPGPRYANVHQDLFTLFSQAGEQKLASKELQILQQAQQANPYGGMGGLGGAGGLGGLGGAGGMPFDVQ